MSGSASKASPNQDAYTWIGASGGAWTAASNWHDTTAGALPASFMPGAGTPVTIAGPAGSVFRVITGGGTAASVAVTGNQSFNGSYAAGTLVVGQRLEQPFSEPTYIAGAVSVAAASRFDLDSLMVASGAVLLAGAGATLVAGGAISLGSAPVAVEFVYDNGASGNLGVGAGATLTAAGSLAVNQGTLTVTGGSASVAGPVSLGSGNAFRTTGIIAVSAGGTLSLGADLQQVYGGVVVSGAGSRISVAGTFVSNAPAYHGAAPAGYVSLAATAGGRAQVGGIDIQGIATNGVVTASRITVDLTGAIEVGTAGQFTAGAITVDAGRTLSAGSDLVLTGAVINNGTILAAGGVLTLSGNLSGSGVVQLGKNATLVLNGSAAAEGTISFGLAPAALVIGASGGNAYTVSATISGFANGDSIVVAGAAADSVTYLAGANGLGTLSLFNGAAKLASLTLAGSYTTGSFLLSPTLSGATGISLAAAPPSGGPAEMSTNADAYAWIGASGGSWNVAANWRDTTTGTTPALFIPGTATPVSIAGSPGAGFTVINGGGAIASLTVTANASLAGDTATGALAVGTRTVPAVGNAVYVAGALALAASSLTASTVTVADGTLSLSGKGAAITVGGTVSLGSAPRNLGSYFDTGAVGVLNVGAGTTLLAAALLVDQGSLTVSGAGALAGVAGSVSLGAVGGAAGANKAAGLLLVTGGGSLAIGGGLTATYGAVAVGGSLSHLTVEGDFTAVAPAYSGASPFGYYSLVATGFGRAQLGGIVILAASGGTIPASFAVDLTGAIEVGTLGTAVAGSITVDAGRSITAAADAVLTGSIVNNGIIASTGGTLTLAGNLSGGGAVRIGKNSTLALNGNAAATSTIVFTDTGATLVIGSAGGAARIVLATISGFQLGDSIVVGGIQADGVLYQPAGADGGTLFLFSGSTVLAGLTLAGSYSNSDFVLSPTDGGATSIALLPPITSGTPSGTSPNADAYAWTGVSGGSWSAASNWRDATTGVDPAIFVPGAGTPVSIAGPAAGAFQVITGGGSSQSLGIAGNVGLSGFYDTGALVLGSRTVPVAANAGYTTGALSLAAGSALSAASVVVASGTLALTGSTLAVAGPASFGSAPLGLEFWFDTGAVGIGRVGAGATLSVGGPLAVNQGTLTVSGAAAEADLAGAITLGAIGADRVAGFLVVGGGGRVVAAGALTAVHGGAVVSGAGSRLIVSGDLVASPPAYFGASPFGYYSLVATTGGTAQVGGIVITASAGVAIAAVIAVDLTGAIEVGTDGTGAAGAITVDAGRSIEASADAVLTGAIVNNGTISETGGSLTLAGNLSGSGVLRIGAGATVVLGGSATGAGQIVFAGAGAALVIGSRTTTTYANGIPVVTRTPYAVTSRISGLAAGNSITVSNAAVTSAAYVATGASLGTLTLMNGAGLVTSLTLSGNYAGSSFFLSPTVNGATSISVVAGPPLPAVTLFGPALVGLGQDVVVGSVVPVAAGDTLTLVIDALPQSGTLLLLADGTIHYVAPAGAPAAQPVGLAFHVIDQAGRSSGLQAASITVNPGPSLRPVAVVVAAGQDVDLTARLHALAVPGVAGDLLTIRAVSTAAGSVGLSGGALRYVGNGAADSFTYTLADQLGNVATASVRVLSAAAARAGITVAAALAPGASTDAATVVSDTAAAVAAGLNGLQALAAAGRLAAIGLLDGGHGVLAITPEQLRTDIGALALVATPHALAQRILAADAATAILAAGFTGFAVVDNAVGLLSGLDAVAALSRQGKLLQILLTDPGTVPGLLLSATELAVGIDALARITTPFTIALTDAGTPAIAIPGWQLGLADGVLARITTPHTIFVTSEVRAATVATIATLPGDLAVLDDARSIAAALAALETAAQAGRLASIQLRGSGPQVLSLTVAQLTGAATAIARLSPNHALSQVITAAEAASPVLDPRFTSFTVQDTAFNLAANLDAIDALARSGELARVRGTEASTYLTVTAAQLGRDALALSLLGAAGGMVIRLSDGGAPTVVIAGGLLGNAAVRAMLNVVADPCSLSPAGTVGAGVAAAIAGENGRVLAGLAAPLDVFDTAAGIAANLTGLATLLARGRLGVITLRDGGALPTLNISAADAAGFEAVLAHIASPFAVAGFFGSAANFLAQIAGLQSLAIVQPSVSYALSNAGSPVLTLTAATLAANLLALSRITTPFSIVLADGGAPMVGVAGWQLASNAIVDVLAKITSAFTLAVVDVLDACAAANLAPLAAHLVGPVAVLDAGPTITANLPALSLLAATGKLATITLLEGPGAGLALTAAQANVNAAALALIATPHTLTQIVGAAAATPAAGFASLTVQDTAAAVLANLPGLQALAAAGVLASISLTDGATLNLTAAFLQANVAALSRVNASRIVLADADTPTLVFDSGPLNDAALRKAVLERIAGSFRLSVNGVADSALAAALASSAKLLGSLATPLQVMDSAVAVMANLAALQQLAAAGLLGSVRLTDAGVPGLALSPADSATYAGVLARITTPFTTTSPSRIAVTLTASDLLARLGTLQAQALAGTLGVVTLTDGGTPVLAMSAARFSAASLALSHVAGSFAITLTDAGTPILLLSGTRAGLFTHVATPFRLGVTAPVDAATAAAIVAAGLTGRLDAALAVADHGSAIAAHLDALQVLAEAGRLAAIATQDSDPALILTAAQLAADAGALAALATPFRLSLATSAADALLAAPGVPVTVRDTAANLLPALATLAPLAASGRLDGIEITGPTVLGLTATALSAGAMVLSRLSGSYSIALLDGGTPNVVLPADLLGSAMIRSAVLNRITGSFTLTVTGAVSAAVAAAVSGEDDRVLGSLATGLVVLDSAAAVVANLAALEALAIGNHLQAINLTDPDVASLGLTAAQAAAFSHALARIGAPHVAGVAGDRLFLTAAGLLGQLETLQAQAAGGFLTHIGLTDAGAPVLLMTAARLAADALALGLIATPFSVALIDAGPVVLHLTGAQAANAGIVAMLGRVATPFTLVIDGPMGAGAAVTLGRSMASRLAAPLAVTDSAAGVAASLDGLQALAAAGLLGAVVLADATTVLAITQATAIADAGALAAVTSPHTLSLITTAASAASTAPIGHFTTLTVQDTAAAIIANLPALQVLAAAGTLAGIQATDTATMGLSAATVAAGMNALAAGSFRVTLTDIALPTIHIAAWQVDAAVLAALNRITGAYVLVVEGALRAADAVRFMAAGGAILASLPALSLQVSDDAAALTPAMLTSLQAMASKIAGLDLRASAATLSLTPTQAAGFATILAKITSPHLLSQTVTAAALGSATLAAGFAGFTVADTAANIVAALPMIQAKAAAGLLERLQPADGSMFVLGSAVLNASLDALAAIDRGAFPIVLTDAEAPVVIVPAGLLGLNLRHVLNAIASPFQLRIAGTLDAATAAAVATENTRVLANLTGQPDVADTAAAIGRALDGLQVLARLGHLSGVLVLDGAVRPITMTAAQFIANADALSHLTGSHSLAITGAAAADVTAMAARAHVASVSVLDSAANVTANLEALQVLAQAGKLIGVAFTDLDPPILVLSLERRAADADVLARIDGPYRLEVPVGNATGLDLGVQAYDWHSHALLSGVQLAVLGQGDRAGNISFRSVHLDAAGRVVAELWVDASGGAQSLGFDMVLPGGASGGFAGAAGLPADWSVQTNTVPGQFSLQAISVGSALSGPTRVGTLTFNVPGSTDFTLDLTGGTVGTQAATPFAITLNRHAIGSDGTMALTGVNFDSYAFTATRSAIDVGRAITAADALAALRIAVGLNPNSAPGTGGLASAPLVSPYQYLAADVNGDGRVTAADALAILRMAVKLPGALAPRWIFVDEAASYWNPVTLKFVSTRSSVGAVGAITAAVPDKMNVGLVGVLTGAVLGRWAPLDAAGRALTPDRYASLPTAYFQNLGTGAPVDQFGYAAAAGGSSLAAIAITAGNVLPTARVAVYDSAANIAASLDRLQTWHAAGRLQSLTFMETTTPIVKLSIAQFAADAGALSTATGIYRLDIAAGQNVASAVTGPGSALSFVGTPDQITIGSSAATIHYVLTPASGVATIANFRYATDRLDIDLGAYATTDLLIRDVVADGRHAIAVSATGAGGHMVVLTGLAPTATSADLASQHLVFLNGHALIG